MNLKKTLGASAALLAFSLPMVVQAQTTTSDPTDPLAGGIRDEAEDEEIKQTISVTGSISTNVGQGTFVSIDDSETDGISNNPPGTDVDNAFDRVSMGYSLIPSYGIDDYIISSRLSVSQYLTAGGGINEPNEVRFSDIPLNFSWAGTEIGAGVRLGAGAGLQFPTSDRSQTSTLVVGTSARTSLSRQFVDSISVALSLSGGKDFHRSISPAVDIEEVGRENVLFREGETLGDSLIVIGGVNTEYALAPTLSASWQFWDFALSASYTLGTYWTYDRDNDDEFTPTLTDDNGNLVADTGRGVSQVTIGSLSLAYKAKDSGVPVLEDLNWVLSAGTAQAPKTADNRSFNFPFWNFSGAAANRSSIGLSVAYTWSHKL